MHRPCSKFAIGGVKKGRNSAIRKISPRRRKRSLKVWAFQVKNATGWTTVRSRRLPSTRQ